MLDTHIWIWWVHGDTQLTKEYQDYIQAQESQGLGISAISCWEVAKLVERDRLVSYKLDGKDYGVLYAGVFSDT